MKQCKIEVLNLNGSDKFIFAGASYENGIYYVLIELSQHYIKKIENQLLLKNPILQSDLLKLLEHEVKITVPQHIYDYYVNQDDTSQFQNILETENEKKSQRKDD